LLEWFQNALIRADILTVVFTLSTVVIASLKNWFIAEQRLRFSFKLMILLGLAYVGLNTNIALNNEGQEIMLLMNIPALWTSLMGIRGLKKLKSQEMAIRSKACKKAIVRWIIQNPGHVASQFHPPKSETSAQLEKNWKRMYKTKEGNLYIRAFNCEPYNDQLRAYTYDDGCTILKIEVQGE